jgi:hypothetical protein
VTAQPFPETASYYPWMGIEAARRASERTAGIGQAWRLWVIGKALDRPGLGMVRRQDLRAYLLQLGASPRQWQRWVIAARNHGFIADIQKGREWWVILPSAGKIALEMGLQTVGPRKVTIHAGELIGKGWKARIMATWEHGKQISREQIQKTINVSVRTQTYRAAQLGDGYERTRNYSKSALKADKFQIVQEHSNHKAPFVSGNGFIYWRLPDKRHSADVLHSSKGRARKVNKFIRCNTEKSKGLSYTRQALTMAFQPGEWIRLFNLTDAQLQQAERRIAKQDRRVSELYMHAGEAASGAGIWRHCPRV